MPFSTLLHIHQDITTGRGVAQKEHQLKSGAPPALPSGDKDPHIATWPMRAEDEQIGLDNLKGSLQRWIL